MQPKYIVLRWQCKQHYKLLWNVKTIELTTFSPLVIESSKQKKGCITPKICVIQPSSKIKSKTMLFFDYDHGLRHHSMICS